MVDSVDIINATKSHLPEIVKIYNQALLTRLATFETRPRSVGDISGWVDETIPLKLAIVNQQVAGFAKVSAYRDRQCYAAIKEYSVYVSSAHQRLGVGEKLMQSLIDACRQQGVSKLLSRIFPENKPSIALAEKVGFRIVGIYHRHGKLDDIWKDCVIVELNL